MLYLKVEEFQYRRRVKKTTKATLLLNVLCLVAQSCPTLCIPMDCSLPGSSVYGDSPRKNTGVGCPALLQGIFPAQGLNPGLLHHKGVLYRLSHQGSPRILEWVAYLFSRGSYRPRNRTGVSCIRLLAIYSICTSVYTSVPLS